jgi:hypothetical protein
MKAVPPLNELFQQAGRVLLEALGKSVREEAKSPVKENPSKNG